MKIKEQQLRQIIREEIQLLERKTKEELEDDLKKYIKVKDELLKKYPDSILAFKITGLFNVKQNKKALELLNKSPWKSKKEALEYKRISDKYFKQIKKKYGSTMRRFFYDIEDKDLYQQLVHNWL